MRPAVPKPVVLLIGTRRSSHDTLKSNINIVQDRGRFMSHADKESWMEQPEVQYVNWGFEPAYLRRLYTPESVLNHYSRTRVAANKLRALRRLRELAPRIVRDPRLVRRLGSSLIVAKSRRGHHGAGKAILPATTPTDALRGYDYFQEYVSGREMRVVVCLGKVINAFWKIRPADCAATEIRPRWRFSRIKLNALDPRVSEMAVEATSRVGLDYSGVDMIWTPERPYVLECNSAPGMGRTTLRRLYDRINEVFNEAD